MALQKVGPYEVDPNEPWKNDKLDRKKVADYLTPVIASVSQPFTISLHSPYGTGKTSFIRSWQADLRKQGYKTVYFNAWETDFSQDAFFAFMEAVQRELKSQEIDSSAAKTIAEKVAKATRKGAGIVGEKALPLILRGLAKKFAGDETIQGVLALIGQSDDSVGELTGALAEEGLKSQRDAEKSRREFRVDLSNTIKSLFAETTPTENRKVLVFVDDLDRCRPSYAIQLLEAIKHLFSVDGLIFILAVDEPQLAQAVTSVYGTGIDARGYLARFLDWRYRLPPPKVKGLCETLALKFGFPEIPGVKENSEFFSISAFVDTISTFAECYSISVRELEQVFTLVNLCLRAQKDGRIPLLPTLAAAAVIRHMQVDELKEALRDMDAREKLLSSLNSRLLSVSPARVQNGQHQFVVHLHGWLISNEEVVALHNKANEFQNKINRGLPHEKLSLREMRDEAARMFSVTAYRSDLASRFGVDDAPIRTALRALETAGQLSAE